MKKKMGWYWNADGIIFRAPWDLHDGQSNNGYYHHHEDSGPYRTFLGCKRVAMKELWLEMKLVERRYLTAKNTRVRK